MSHPKRRLIGAPAALATAAFTAALLVPFGALPAGPAAAAIGECPTGTIPAPGTPAENALWTDANVAVYAGGDFLADGGAAESEGLLVVEGDATFDKEFAGRFNVGWVGVGSQVTAPPGSTMLAVGGNLTVAASTVLDVGSGASEPDGSLLGGDVLVGGSVSPVFPAPQYELNNGSLASGLGTAALADYSGFGALVTDTSADLATEPVTGATSVAGNTVTFTGDGQAAALQVFTLTAAQASAITEVYFIDIADDAPVVINVTGGPSVTLAHNYIANDGDRADDLTSSLFGMVAARTLWNIVDATTVNLAGSSQLLGSILAPGADLDITASTNGRVYAGGDIRMHGVGNELHNYPWIAAPFDCVPTTNAVTGTVTLQKLLADGSAGFLPVGPSGLPKFAGTVECAVAEGGTFAEEWTLRPPNVITIEGLPVGAECTIAEDLTRVSQDRDGLADVPLRDLVWAEPVWTVNGETVQGPVTFIVPAPGSSTNVALTVANELRLGSFAITKTVENLDALEYVDAFSGAWSCTHVDAPGMSGTWSLGAGETTPSFEVPLGSECAVVEDAPDAPADAEWATSIAPAEFTISSDETVVAVTVTNTLSADRPTPAPTPTPTPDTGPRPDSDAALPATGATVPWWAIAVGGALLVAGAAVSAVTVTRRRRG
ncbi:choice-of-anchor A family protein [Microbacterium sp. M3]|uniref:Choice-of-anchor A family protein n=1 Tax=Microbacterium arthrosphaerae TaxID=792652 RepID=A0ABU4H3J2_9MICO|nr:MULTISPECIES: choice-of-anchor A family protein [Microbacterium]MDW4573902.1 choice-of-anchor A family protein [Microbacterium arthrosphaerae]MDW7607757.1 choice-of-anchor A family protein [Microbacterium sp. M3]